MTQDTIPRLGLLYAGDAGNPRTWSGIPFSLAEALRTLGVDLHTLDAQPPGVGILVNALALVRATGHAGELLNDPRSTLRRARWGARATPTMANVATLWARRRLRSVSLDAVVQVQADFCVSRPVPLATYEDLTVVQALRHDYTEFAYLSPAERKRRILLQRGVYQRATACCTATHWARASIINDYGIDPERVHVVGVGAGSPPTGDDDKDWSVPRFLFVGVDWERKNGPAVVRAFRRIRDTFDAAELHVVGHHPPLGGDGVFGHGRLALDSIEDRARLWSLFRTATCFVMPSRVEPAGIAYLEAASCGVASIGTTVGGSRELIAGGGLVVEPDDDEALFQAMIRLSDPETASRLGRKARERAELYTWPMVAARILAALNVPGFDEPSLAPYE